MTQAQRTVDNDRVNHSMTPAGAAMSPLARLLQVEETLRELRNVAYTQDGISLAAQIDAVLSLPAVKRTTVDDHSVLGYFNDAWLGFVSNGPGSRYLSLRLRSGYLDFSCDVLPNRRWLAKCRRALAALELDLNITSDALAAMESAE